MLDDAPEECVQNKKLGTSWGFANISLGNERGSWHNTFKNYEVYPVFLKLALSVLLIVIVCTSRIEAQTSAQFFELGKASIEAKNYGTAIEQFTKVIELSPTNASAYYNRGLAHLRLREYEPAVADYTKAIQLKPDFYEPYVNRAISYKALRQPGLALADYTQAIQLRPTSSLAHLNRGILNLEQSYLDAALADLSRSIELDNTVSSAFYNRGNVYTALSKWPESISDFYSAIRLDPSRATLHYPLAWMEMHVGNNQAAYANAVKFLETKGMDHDRTAYTLVTGYLALLRDGKKTDAEGFVARFPRGNAPGNLPARILDFLRGELNEEDLLKLTGDDKRKLTDVRSIIGLKQLLDGKMDEARTNFSWVKEYGAKSPAAYALAMVELQKLEKKQ